MTATPRQRPYARATGPATISPGLRLASPIGRHRGDGEATAEPKATAQAPKHRADEK